MPTRLQPFGLIIGHAGRRILMPEEITRGDDLRIVTDFQVGVPKLQSLAAATDRTVRDPDEQVWIYPRDGLATDIVRFPFQSRTGSTTISSMRMSCRTIMLRFWPPRSIDENAASCISPLRIM